MSRASWAIAGCALIGFFLPALTGMVAGIPAPLFHDEFSYLLGADTFAHGRLANPAPPLPEFFEAPHILVTPAYATKYPPAQSAALAIGQILFGRPIAGVWLTCGLFAAALCWALQAWVSVETAWRTTLVVAITSGMASYWAQSYWGGMVAATGGALMIGGAQRTIEAPRLQTTVSLAAGLLLIGNSRPFEGLMASVGPACIAVQALLRNPTAARSRLLTVTLPLAVTLSIGGAAMAAYNRAVTGDWREFPYQLHVRQYLPEGLLIFSASRTPSRHPPERLARIYRGILNPPVRGLRAISVAAKNLVERSVETIGSAFGAMRVPRPGRPPFAGVSLWLAFLLIHQTSRTRRWWIAALCLLLGLELLSWWSDLSYPLIWIPVLMSAFAIALPRMEWSQTGWLMLPVLLVLLGQSIVHWWAPHYAAPILPAITVIAAVTLDRMSISRSSPPASDSTQRAQVLNVALSVYAVAVVLSAGVLRGAEHLEPSNVLATRVQMDAFLRTRAGTHLIFVRYDPTYTVHSEWVYNAADLQTAPLVYAHDLGPTRNAALIHALPGRMTWQANISDRVELGPYRTE